MKRSGLVIAFAALSIFLGSCAHVPADRYNTQKGAAIGAGIGALLGQAIGRNPESTLLGFASGTLVGAVVGNALDQSFQATKEAARNGKPVVDYDKQGYAVEPVPESVDKRTHCHTIKKRVWRNGELVSETVEEICEDDERYVPRPYIVYRYYSPPYVFYPYLPMFHFHFRYDSKPHHPYRYPPRHPSHPYPRHRRHWY